MPFAHQQSSSSTMECTAIRSDVQGDSSPEAMRKVTFAGVGVIEIIPETDAQETWYSIRDLAKLKRSNRYTIMALRRAWKKNDMLDDEEYCSRGLEDQVSIRAQIERKRNVSAVVQAVLNEQRRQKESRKFDPNRISIESQRHSSKAKSKAFDRAFGDSQEALGAVYFKDILSQRAQVTRPLDVEMFTSRTNSASFTLGILIDALAIIEST